MTDRTATVIAVLVVLAAGAYLLSRGGGGLSVESERDKWRRIIGGLPPVPPPVEAPNLSATQGALMGAQAGAVAGPYGAGIGAGVGFAYSFFD